MSKTKHKRNIIRWLNHPEERNQITLLASYIDLLGLLQTTKKRFGEEQINMIWKGRLKTLFSQESIDNRWIWFLRMLVRGASFKTPAVDAWEGGLQDKFLSLNNADLQDVLCLIFKSNMSEIIRSVIQLPNVQEYGELLKTTHNLAKAYALFFHSLTGQSAEAIRFAESIFFSFDVGKMLTQIEYNELQNMLSSSASNPVNIASIKSKLEKCCPQFVDPVPLRISRKRPLEEDKKSFKEEATQPDMPATMPSLSMWDEDLPIAIPVSPPSPAPILATSGFSLFSYHNKEDLVQCNVDEKLSCERSTLNDFKIFQSAALLTSLAEWIASFDKDEQHTVILKDKNFGHVRK